MFKFIFLLKNQFFIVLNITCYEKVKQLETYPLLYTTMEFLGLDKIQFLTKSSFLYVFSKSSFHIVQIRYKAEHISSSVICL